MCGRAARGDLLTGRDKKREKNEAGMTEGKTVGFKRSRPHVRR